jgi:hypothetical protein
VERPFLSVVPMVPKPTEPSLIKVLAVVTLAADPTITFLLLSITVDPEI